MGSNDIENLDQKIRRVLSDPDLISSRSEIAQLRLLVEEHREQVQPALSLFQRIMALRTAQVESLLERSMAQGTLDREDAKLLRAALEEGSTQLAAINQTMTALALNMDQIRKAVRQQADLEGRLGFLIRIEQVISSMSELAQLLIREGFIPQERAFELSQFIRYKFKLPVRSMISSGFPTP